MMSSHGHGSCPVHANFDPLSTEFLAQRQILSGVLNSLPWALSPNTIAVGFRIIATTSCGSVCVNVSCVSDT
jgi:hypothetical protein